MPSMRSAFGLGLMVGAVTGLLYAPKRGSENRAYVKARAMVARDRALDSAEWLGDKSMAVKDRAVDSAKWMGRKTMQIVDAVKAPVGDGSMTMPVYETIEYYFATVPEREESETVAQVKNEMQTATREIEKQSKLLGPNGEEVGRVLGVLADPQTNEAQYAVVALNSRKNEQELCSVPWSALKETEEGNYQGDYTCSLPTMQIQQSPTFTESEIKKEPESRSLLDRIRGYYRQGDGKSSGREP